MPRKASRRPERGHAPRRSSTLRRVTSYHIARARAVLGREPAVGLEEGVAAIG